jgi:hypothetical protein
VVLGEFGFSFKNLTEKGSDVGPDSMQDRILIEVWEKTDNAVKVEESEPQPEVILDSPTKLANMRGIFKKQNAVRRKKVAVSALGDAMNMAFCGSNGVM